MRKRIYKISLLLLLFGCTIALNMSRKEKKQLDADTNQSDTGKIIICISEDEVWNAYDETNNIILKDGGLSVIDYDEREKKILYVNQENKIVELEMDTGQKNTILLPLISESPGENSKEIQNPKYGPKNGEISFLLNDYLYIYNRDEDSVRGVVPCKAEEMQNTYEWTKEGDLYIVDADEEGNRLLKQLQYGTNEMQMKEISEYAGIVNFVLDEPDRKIYGVQPRAMSELEFALDVRYCIVELDPVGQEWKICKRPTGKENINDGIIFLEKGINGKYLLYAERWFPEKTVRLYCLNLETGKSKCIYKTNQDILGIVLK